MGLYENLDKIYEKGSPEVWNNLLRGFDNSFYENRDEITIKDVKYDSTDLTKIIDAIHETAKVAIQNKEIYKKHEDVVLQRFMSNFPRNLSSEKASDNDMIRFFVHDVYRRIRFFVEYIFYKKINLEEVMAAL